MLIRGRLLSSLVIYGLSLFIAGRGAVTLCAGQRTSDYETEVDFGVNHLVSAQGAQPHGSEH